jgi:hypothetical protein
MKRVYSIDEVKSIAISDGYIDLFFYKGYCDYSNQVYRLLLSHKYMDIYIVSYKIFDTLTVQLNVDVVPSIIRLTPNGVENRYIGKSEISKYILSNEKSIESQIVKEIYKEKTTQTLDSHDSPDANDASSDVLTRYIVNEPSDSDNSTI